MRSETVDMIELTIPKENIRHERGHCWTAVLPDDVAYGDTLDDPMRSALQLYEDRRPLGPRHADHNRIRVAGEGLYSHWHKTLFFSTSDNSDPTASSRSYILRAPRRVANGEEPVADAPADNGALFPRLAAVRADFRGRADSASLDLFHNPEGDAEQRIRALEAKVEYLLDEVYTAKSQLRHLLPLSQTWRRIQDYQIGTFDFQWKNLPYHDMFFSNPAWRDKAVDDLCARLERPREWLEGKRVLDCGCGPGRHSWTFASLGARVTAFDTSDNALAAARQECAAFAAVTVEKRNILEPLPYDIDYDLVWCYGVIHCTGDTYRALANIARHVRPGGMIYFMVYPEPERTNFDSYRYYHEVYALRQLTRRLGFAEKAEFLKKIQGERWALSWFDAISSEINDLYTIEELADMLGSLGFEDVKRTMPHEHSLNVTATRAGVSPACP